VSVFAISSNTIQPPAGLCRAWRSGSRRKARAKCRATAV
jgi:hypothetical protein